MAEVFMRSARNCFFFVELWEEESIDGIMEVNRRINTELSGSKQKNKYRAQWK